LLYDLIITAHDQPHVALASADHLRYIAKFINETTKHMYYVCCSLVMFVSSHLLAVVISVLLACFVSTNCYFQVLSVEKSNFHTIFRTIDEINKQTSVAFCAIQVTGKLSGLDISRLVGQSIHGNVRIMLHFSPQVLLSLQVTQQIDSVRIPNSLRQSHQTR
jgi:hypothetical protein